MARGDNVDDRVGRAMISPLGQALADTERGELQDRCLGWDWSDLTLEDRAFIIRGELQVSANMVESLVPGTYAPDPALEDRDVDELDELEAAIAARQNKALPAADEGGWFGL